MTLHMSVRTLPAAARRVPGKSPLALCDPAAHWVALVDWREEPISSHLAGELQETFDRAAGQVRPLLDVSDEKLDRPAMRRFARDAMSAASASLRRTAQGRPERLASATLVIVAKTSALVAHVGDAPVLMRRADLTHLLAHPQTVGQWMRDFGRTGEHSGWSHPSAGKLLHGLGEEGLVQPEVRLVALMKGDELVLTVRPLAPPTKASPRDLAPTPRTQVVLSFGDKATTVAAPPDDLSGVTPESGAPLDRQAHLAEHLRATELFEGLGLRQILVVLGRMRARTLEPGEILYHAGEPSHGLYLLTMGKLIGEAPGGLRVVFEPRAVVGERGLTEGDERLLTVRAKNGAQVLGLLREDLDALCHQHPTLGGQQLKSLARILAARLRRQIRRNGLAVD